MGVSAIPAQSGLSLSGTVADRMAEAAQPFTSYTPTVGGITTSSKGAEYKRNGDWIRVEFYFIANAAGSGTLSLSLPVNAATPAYGFGSLAVRGRAIAYDSSASSRTVGEVFLVSATTVNFFVSGAGDWAAAVPFVWASPDAVSGWLEYKAA